MGKIIERRHRLLSFFIRDLESGLLSIRSIAALFFIGKKIDSLDISVGSVTRNGFYASKTDVAYLSEVLSLLYL